MTNEEAIEELEDLRSYCYGLYKTVTRNNEMWLSNVKAIDMAIKALEQENTPDKIRAEIEKERSFQIAKDEYCVVKGLRKALEIIDKYRESEE